MLLVVRRLFFLSLLALTFSVAVGCQESRYYPVSGKVLDEAGQPFTELAGAPISFEAVGEPVSAVGTVMTDATFAMTTESNEDGCLPGEHRVSVGRVYYASDAPGPKVISSKYDRYDTSELKVTVEKKNNYIELKLKRLKPKD